jgi:flagellar basal-body rod protein FlgB
MPTANQKTRIYFLNAIYIILSQVGITNMFTNRLLKLVIVTMLYCMNGYSFAKPLTKSKEPTTNQLLHNYLNRLSFRHKVLSQNIANINTPGYKANEVKMPENIADLELSKGRRRLSLINTAYKHMKGRYAETNQFEIEKLKDPFEVKPNGNNVSLNQQITKISQNQTAYDAALKTYSISTGLISTALGK